jgi:sugar phosphate isomerase/epimerase
MLNLAFSTVACPDWTLPAVARAAGECGYHGAELRTFGYDSREFACDPALTDPVKLRTMFADAGVAVACIATGVSFDAPIRPPVIGRVLDTEASIRRAKMAIEIAAQVEAPFVRIFGFEFGRENRNRALARIAERLALAADACRNTGVRLVLENGGDFRTSAEMIELLDRVGSPLVGASYSAAVALQAEEDPIAGAAVLGDRLWMVKIKDQDANGKPRLPGDGVVPCRGLLTSLASRGHACWAVFEWDRAWIPTLAAAEQVLPEVARRMTEWAGHAAPAPV